MVPKLLPGELFYESMTDTLTPSKSKADCALTENKLPLERKRMIFRREEKVAMRLKAK